MQYAAAGLLLLVMACGASSKVAEPSGPTQEKLAEESGTTAGVTPRSPELLWWQGATPLCDKGELKRRNLSWGSVLWCAQEGVAVDQSLQNDLSKLARCVHESVSAFQEEPVDGKLGEFLARAHESGLNAELCNAVRRDADVRTYHGRRVLMERRVETSNDDQADAVSEVEAGNEIEVRYRFSCDECAVASETSAKVLAR